MRIGLWFMVYGLWFMVYGLWFMVYGLNLQLYQITNKILLEEWTFFLDITSKVANSNGAA